MGKNSTYSESESDQEEQPDNDNLSDKKTSTGKTFSPDSNMKKQYCLCQKEAYHWYITCSVQSSRCLKYYHTECVGLEKIKSIEVAEKFSNCADEISYVCPLCSNSNSNYDEKTLVNELDTEHTKSVTDDNSDNSSIMSEEFPLYQNKKIASEGSISNSPVDEFPDSNSFDAGTLHAVVENSNYNTINSDENLKYAPISNEKPQLQNSLKSKDSKTEEENRLSKRRRYIPKVFTPESDSKKVWCLCQQEDKGFYILCDLKKPRCLEFCHPACVGLGHLKSPSDCDNYSNCSDVKSYICSLCGGKVSREQWYSCENIIPSTK